MSESDEVNELLNRIIDATDEISKLKARIRQHRAMDPESDIKALESALSYWEQDKQEAEQKLRRLSNL